MTGRSFLDVLRGPARAAGQLGRCGAFLVTLAGAATPHDQLARAGRSFFVSPSASAAGDGSPSAPWPLATALTNANDSVQPGDTIWLRGGTYAGDFRSVLRGTTERPIVVRQASGERAIIDGRINAYGSHTVFWGFEIAQSDPLRSKLRGIDVRGPGHRFVNLVIHDVGGSGIGFWMEGVDAEVYGCIVYNNGFQSSLHHGIYAINRDGRKSIVDNVVFNNFAYGIQVYGAVGQALRHFTIEGNVAFGNGSISAADRSKSNLIVGGKGIPAEDVVIAHNVFLYGEGVRTPNVRLGYDPGIENGDVRLEGNTLIGGDPVLQMLRWHDVVAERNVLAGSGRIVSVQAPPAGRDVWRANVFLAAPGAAGAVPPRTPVIVRPNRYEPGRAHVVVLNWAGERVVKADLSAVLRVGDRYELRSVQHLFGAPVVSGRYEGGAVEIPMRSLAAPATVGRVTPPPPVTGPFFDVLLLRSLP